MSTKALSHFRGPSTCMVQRAYGTGRNKAISSINMYGPSTCRSTVGAPSIALTRHLPPTASYPSCPVAWDVFSRSSSSRRWFSSQTILRQEDVLNKLRAIIDPDLKKDIVTLGFIKQLTIVDNKVSFELELTTPACPVKDKFQEAATRVVKELSWVEDCVVTMTARPRPGGRGAGLSNVTHIIAVASCKGGVGKSSISVNLAYMISAMGAKCGILDADIYGPSLPHMVKPENTKVVGTKAGGIIPLEYEGVKLMSMGFLRPNEAAAIRGPMVSAMVQQMLTQTQWGDLDYLIIDMPPGTGDIHLTIAQSAHVDAAVVVTTPQKLSLVDVEKGINMFNTVKIPTLALVENMSYFQCGHCGEKSEVFSQGAGEHLAKQFGLDELYFRVPIDPKLGNSDTPYVLQDNEDSVVWKELKSIAIGCVQALSVLKETRGLTPQVTTENGEIIIRTKNKEKRLDDRFLRLECRSAIMRDEFTGEKIFDEKTIPEDVHAVKIEPCGAYAVRIDWSDGHHSLFPYKLLEELG